MGLPLRPESGAVSEWDKANPGAAYDPELFRRDILPRLATVKLSEIAEAAGCSKAYACRTSGEESGRLTCRLGPRAELANVEFEFVAQSADIYDEETRR